MNRENFINGFPGYESGRRREGRAVIAGYDLINEPMVNSPSGDLPRGGYENYWPDWYRLNGIHRELAAAVREIDHDHSLFLEGDGYGHFFDGLKPPFADNQAYIDIFRKNLA